MSIRKREWTTSDGAKRQAFVVDFKNSEGVRERKHFARKKDAEAWWGSQQGAVAIQEGTYVSDRKSITVAEAGADWIKRAELDKRERSTVAQYRQHVEQHINPRLGAVKLSKLTTPGVERFRDELLEALSRPMAKKVLTSFKGLLKEAQRRGKVPQNVALPVTVRMAKRDKRKVEVGVDVPTPDEVRQIVAAAKGPWRPLLITAIFTGMRSSELRGLTWDGVDFDDRVIRVRQRADRWHELGELKSHAGDRDIPMPPLVLNTLKEWKLACPKGKLGLVFPTEKGKVQSQANIYARGLGGTLKACGLVDDKGRQKYGMHALRHFYASWLIGQGFRPKRVQELLGHSSIQQTFDVYGHWFKDEEDDHERLAAGELAVIG